MSQQPAQTTQTAIPAQILQSFDEFLAQLDTVERSGKAFFDKVENGLSPRNGQEMTPALLSQLQISLDNLVTISKNTGVGSIPSDISEDSAMQIDDKEVPSQNIADTQFQAKDVENAYKQRTWMLDRAKAASTVFASALKESQPSSSGPIQET